MAPTGAQAVVDAVVDALNDFTEGAHQRDDITLVALRRES